MFKFFLLISLFHGTPNNLNFHKNVFSLTAAPISNISKIKLKPIIIANTDYVFGVKYYRVKFTIKPTLYRNPVTAIENLKLEPEDAVAVFNDALSSVAKFDVRFKFYITKNFRLIFRVFTQSKSVSDIYTGGIAWRF